VILFNVKLLTSREFLSLGKKDAPDDFKSLKRGEISSFNIVVEKFEIGDEFGISESTKTEFNHLLFKKVFLFHFELREALSGLLFCTESFSADSKEFFSKKVK
jgi:hypothetical protein